MLPTPDTSHVPYNLVYEPAEDSFLLLDTLSSASETAFLTSRFSPVNSLSPSCLTVLEVGSGSGVVSAFLTAHAESIFASYPLTCSAGSTTSDKPDARPLTTIITLATDLNPFACEATRATVVRTVRDQEVGAGAATSQPDNGTKSSKSTPGEQEESVNRRKNKKQTCASFICSLRADLAAPLRPHVVDVLVFNPPYVPSRKLPRWRRKAANGGQYSDNSDGDGEDDNDDDDYEEENAKEGREETSLSVQARNDVSEMDEGYLLRLACAGGKHGLEVTDRLLAELPHTLSRRGVAYVLLCRRNRPEEVKARVRAWPCNADPTASAVLTPESEGATSPRWTWCAETVGSSGKRAGWELLEVVRIWRNLCS